MTLASPVIIRDNKSDQWLTLVEPRELVASNGRKISRQEVLQAMFAPGDGRVTRHSLLAESSTNTRENDSLYDSSLRLVYAAFLCDGHSELHKNKTLLDNALTVLVSKTMNLER